MVPSFVRPFPPKQGRGVVAGPVDAVARLGAVAPIVALLAAIVDATVVGVRSSKSLLVAAAALVALVAPAGPLVAFGEKLAPVVRKVPSEVEMLDYCMPSAVRSCLVAFPVGLSCCWSAAVLVD